MATIAPQELNDLHRQGKPIRLVDVRTPSEFTTAHVPFAENQPLESLDPTVFAQACKADPQRAIYVICQKGSRGANACVRLAAAGVQPVINVEGGTSAWEQAGLPVVRGVPSMSLERQVRIAAGSLVLVGLALGYFVHPYFVGLTAFVGAGLVFAGVTDTCGMGMLLARMPWNQVKASSVAAST
jgi:rhodanese-related sulfurtransferase